MQRWEGKVAIITGASSGTGSAIAKALVQKGVIVVGLARRIDKIEELSKSLSEEPGKLYALRCDVTREDDILKSFKWIAQNVGIVHILINNAGVTRPTSLTDGSSDDWKKVVDVNVIAVCICTREASRVMIENHIKGHIIHMNSIAGHYVPLTPEASLNVYPASKHAVTALAATLSQELKFLGQKIKVTSLSPGLVQTEFSENLNESARSSYRPNIPILKPDDIAEAVIYVLSTGPNVQVTELTIRPLGELV